MTQREGPPEPIQPADAGDSRPAEQLASGSSEPAPSEARPGESSEPAPSEALPGGSSEPAPSEALPGESSATSPTQPLPVSAGPPAEPPSSAAPPVGVAPAAQPLVGWGPPAAVAPVAAAGEYEGGPPPFTTGALLSDTFARYGADPLRIFALSAVATVLSYGASFLTNPVLAPPGGRGFLDLGGILGLVSLVVGVLMGSTTIALLEGGPRMGFGRVIRRGVERAGWMVLTAIILGLGAFVLFLIAAIPIVLIAIASPNAAIVLFLLLALVVVWAFLRVGLAMIGNVADDLNTVDAIKLSWRSTRPTGVWLRIVACSVLLGILAVPASIGALAVTFVGAFTDPILLVVASLLLALLAPLSSILLYSAYRRLVPPFQPHWAAPAPGALLAAAAAAPAAPPAAPSPTPPTDAAASTPPPSASGATAAAEPAIPPLAPLVAWDPPAAAGAPAPSAANPAPEATAAWGEAAAAVSAAPRPVFRAPRFDAGAKFVLVVMLVLGAAGIAAVSWLVAEVASGRINLPAFPTSPTNPGFPGFPGADGSVAPGTIAFGSSADLDTCTVGGQTVFATSSTDVFWVAALSRRTTATDQVTFRVTLDGTEIINIQEPSGVYDCLGTDVPEEDLTPGVYVFEYYLNGTLDATGTLFVG